MNLYYCKKDENILYWKTKDISESKKKGRVNNSDLLFLIEEDWGSLNRCTFNLFYILNKSEFAQIKKMRMGKLEKIK